MLTATTGFKGTAAVIASGGATSPKPATSMRKPSASTYAAAPSLSASPVVGGGGAEHELVTASKEQATEALEIAKEAESMLPGLSSATQRQAAQAGIAELRDWASKARL